MKRIVLTIALGMLAGCAAPPSEGAEPQPANPQDQGPGGCGNGNSFCYTGAAPNITYGHCAGTLCCTTCIDARGNCQAGTTDLACGGGGEPCADCTGIMPHSGCFNYGCSPTCTTFTGCDAWCGGKPDGTPCNLCGLGGACSGNKCKQVQAGPLTCT